MRSEINRTQHNKDIKKSSNSPKMNIFHSQKKSASSWARTKDPLINSQML